MPVHPRDTTHMTPSEERFLATAKLALSEDRLLSGPTAPDISKFIDLEALLKVIGDALKTVGFAALLPALKERVHDYCPNKIVAAGILLALHLAENQLQAAPGLGSPAVSPALIGFLARFLAQLPGLIAIIASLVADTPGPTPDPGPHSLQD